ncbi:uncharacterized protein LOC123676623 [Harmonia axyridis]|uniref:uncharacterized protein LOC123676623 n=1 Tax=Harmonia axyridis TaxID=115357 RepID=UPI001E279453|nr:uncharacterized protein LOC123676623 [Harmonia axyridis]
MNLWILFYVLGANFIQLFADYEYSSIGKHNQNMRQKRQSSDNNEVNSEFPSNTQNVNQEPWNFNDDEDAIVFDDDDFNLRRTFTRQVTFEQFSQTSQNIQENSPSTVPTILIPAVTSRRGPRCEETCPSTTEYNPVCGDDNVTYPNFGKLQCAARCGRSVSLQFRGACLTRPRGR